MKNRIKGIGFDYGGVIRGEASSTFTLKLCDLLDIDINKYKDAYFSQNTLLMTDKITYEEFWRNVLSRVGKSNKEKSLFDFLKDKKAKKSINISIIELIDKLRTGGYKVGLLSNAAAEFALDIRNSGVCEHFDEILISSEIGHAKPSREAFKLLAERLSVNMDELIFIDDTEQSLVGAKEIGYHPVLFRNYETLVADLKSLGVKM
jgi:HAD superfamily hydrolase (TIGR01509 family)